MQNDIQKLPKFAKEIHRFVATTPQFILFGNIFDVFPLPMNEKYIPYPLTKFIGEMLLNYTGYDLIVEYKPLEGFSLCSGDQDLFRKITERYIDDRIVVLNEVFRIIERLMENKENKVAVIINFSSRLLEISAGKDYSEFMYNCFKLSINQTPLGNPPLFNLVIFLVEKDNDMPPWYTLENPRVRSISIPKPDFEIRRWMAQAVLPRIPGWDGITEEKKEEVVKSFVDLTSGMYSREMVSIVQLSIRENIDILDIGESIRRYKVGVPDNPWAKIDREKLINAEEHLRKRVIGQEQAVRVAAAILRRSYFNLSGSQYSKYSTRPKGTLFFAGPTGVGKTELAKSIAELIFGSEHNYIRFDMSEFSQEHTNQRLIGSPPGYVGYETGGELTNAIKQKPFSVVLFDEIEKAHPRILDIFLQILDDGRLTSGKGETVYFSECLIIFTSNLGVYEMTPTGERIQNISPNMEYPKIKEKLLYAIQDYFKFKISRPEILNRIGENIVVFDFIRPKDARLIMNKMINNLKYKLEDERKIKLELTPQVEQEIYMEIIKDLSMGGRGIGNRLELILINPLTQLLFKIFPEEGSTVTITQLNYDPEQGWTLEGHAT
jgi:DNA polymerase III delta prime subunit